MNAFNGLFSHNLAFITEITEDDASEPSQDDDEGGVPKDTNEYFTAPGGIRKYVCSRDNRDWACQENPAHNRTYFQNAPFMKWPEELMPWNCPMCDAVVEAGDNGDSIEDHQDDATPGENEEDKRLAGHTWDPEMINTTLLKKNNWVQDDDGKGKWTHSRIIPSFDTAEEAVVFMNDSANRHWFGVLPARRRLTASEILESHRVMSRLSDLEKRLSEDAMRKL